MDIGAGEPPARFRLTRVSVYARPEPVFAERSPENIRKDGYRKAAVDERGLGNGKTFREAFQDQGFSRKP